MLFHVTNEHDHLTCQEGMAPGTRCTAKGAEMDWRQWRSEGVGGMGAPAFS